MPIVFFLCTFPIFTWATGALGWPDYARGISVVLWALFAYSPLWGRYALGALFAAYTIWHMAVALSLQHP